VGQQPPPLLGDRQPGMSNKQEDEMKIELTSWFLMAVARTIAPRTARGGMLKRYLLLPNGTSPLVRWTKLGRSSVSLG